MQTYLYRELDNMKLLIEHAPSDQEAYFDNPTLSDLKIILADRTIHAHGIILCRSSRYFRELFTGDYINSDVSQIVLLEDDPDALTAMFRAMYGLPYCSKIWDEYVDLLPHAQAYAVAHKFGVPGLCSIAKDNIKEILDEDGPKANFVPALRLIWTAIEYKDDPARQEMVRFCSRRWIRLLANEDFLTLLSDLPEIETTVTTYDDFDIGKWVCDGGPDCARRPMCAPCSEPFSEEDAWGQRFDVWFWYCICSVCICHYAIAGQDDGTVGPICMGCRGRIGWKSELRDEHGRKIPYERRKESHIEGRRS